jgi:hypothetical protein
MGLRAGCSQPISWLSIPAGGRGRQGGRLGRKVEVEGGADTRPSADVPEFGAATARQISGIVPRRCDFAFYNSCERSRITPAAFPGKRAEGIGALGVLRSAPFHPHRCFPRVGCVFSGAGFPPNRLGEPVPTSPNLPLLRRMAHSRGSSRQRVLMVEWVSRVFTISMIEAAAPWVLGSSAEDDT